ncbi:SOS response-associated peptidase [Aquimarina spongiae]|uniref:Abasic site processing protein n=1 Tax=Aquimarina spongiae TaxID=570521 RepID=A0A1M6JEU3_9FLAO|nr:SOS response-associated peptidase [Aquimarina spongiae]SHJ45165.1 SOS response associated peptidase (SRAP) [Aquimarina spongiae]
MCYDVHASLKSQLKRAKHYGNKEAIKEIEEKIVPQTELPLFHAQGQAHKKLLIYTDKQPEYPTVSTWGLVPSWVKDTEQLKKFWNNTLNARGETIFEKPSFRYSAKNRRCLIYIDGFYEHHHFNKKTYPFHIHRKDGEPLILAGLWNEWTDKQTGEILNTFSIVTTEGNSLLSGIHNNPRLKGPRMPVILPDEIADNWLNPINDELDQKAIQELIRPYPDSELDYYTVDRLRGKAYIGNKEEITHKFEYEELEYDFND